MYEKICPHCGAKLSVYLKTGMLGCRYCYETFEDEIFSDLKKIQGKTYHVGKTTKFSTEDKRLLSEYRRLLTEKEKAGIEGRFDDMAGISEDIFVIAEELKKRGLI